MPHPLQQHVASVRRWWNRRAAIEFVCWFLAIAVGVFVAAGVVDYLLRTTDRGSRILLTATCAAVLAAAAWRLARAWRNRRWSDFATAQVVQRSFPQLGDRLASALEFLRQEEDDPTAGSAPLRRSVVSRATADVENLSIQTVATSRSLVRPIVAAVLALAVIGVAAVAVPSATLTAISRIAVPWNNAEWPRINDLAFVEAPEILARGGTFEAALQDQRGRLPDEVAIEYRYRTNGRYRHEKNSMQRAGETMIARRENVRRSFEYRAIGGDHRTMQWKRVEVVDPPAATQLTLTQHPPDYSGLSVPTVESGARVLSGSSIAIRAIANQPLATAHLRINDNVVIEGEVDGSDRRQLRFPAGAWVPKAEQGSRSVRPTLRLEAENGLASDTPLPVLEVVADRSPELEWLTPAEDLYVVSRARVPVTIAASDNLAIAAAELRTDVNRQGDGDEAPAPVTLYEGQQQPPVRDGLPAEGRTLDQQQFAYELNLEPMNLPAGSILQLTASATDYQPSEGTVPAARQITIITAAELDSRLAADQAEILRLLEQALADERSSQSQSAEVADSTSDGQVARRETVDQLLSARLAQQSVRRTLTGPRTGVADRVAAVLERISMNGLEHPELVAQLQQITRQVNGLDNGPLPDAEQHLTSLRKEFEALLNRNPTDQQQLSRSEHFASLAESQRTIIETLEALIAQAAAWSDADRFIRELARLEQEERELRDATLEAARRNMQAAADPAAQKVEQAELDRLAGTQADLARRFDKLALAMRQMIGSEQTTSDFGTRLQDSLDAAESQSLSMQLSESNRQLASGQLGRAAETQLSSADILQEMVQRLRDRSPTDPEELASRLRELQQQLAQLEQAARDAAGEEDRDEQKQKRNELAESLDRVARDLERMTAPAAGEKAQQASKNASPEAGESPEQAQQKLAQAQEDIKQAQQELAQRIEELEQEEQKRLLDRLAEVLGEMVPRQQNVLEGTLKIELVREMQGTLGDAERKQTAQLAEDEQKLSEVLGEAIADLSRRAVFQLALRGAADDMSQASQALANADTGRLTQNLELSALNRMRHVLEVLRDLPPTPPEQQPADQGGGEGGQQQPQRPPLIELAEIKMLRWMQVDLNSRTRLYEADIADNAGTAAARREAAERLSAEQQRLEELVREMMQRNNDNSQPAVDL